jgi:hypothetical protein
MNALVKTVLLTLLETEEDDGYIAVDLDGTLAKTSPGPYRSTKIGEPVPEMVRRVRRWVSHGKKVKIFTARADDEKSVNAIKRWLKDNELPDLEITNLKTPQMIEFWDDRAVAVQKNTGKVKESTRSILRHLLDEDTGDWSPNWEPDESVLAWFRNFLNTPKRFIQWEFRDEPHIYLIDKLDRVVWLLRGDVNDERHWHDKTKKTFEVLGFYVIDHPPPPGYGNDEQCGFAESYLAEAPECSTLKDHAVKLDPEERAAVMKAGAVWHFGKGGAASPAVKKSVVRGKTWYWSATHRCYQADPTLKAAIKSFHDVVEPSS